MDFQSSIQPMGFQPIVFEFFALMQRSNKKNQGYRKKAKNLNDCLK
jgi:hypothetical protein